MDPYRAVGITRATPLWHGGAPGIAPGDYIESAATLRRRGISYGQRPYKDDPTVVYISPNRDFARAFATRTDAFRSNPTLYRIEPLPASSLAPDEDFPAHLSLTCARARVVDVDEQHVDLTDTEALAIIGPHMTWTDGRPVYDHDGYMTPAANWPGANPNQIRSLGRWLQIQDVQFNSELGIAKIVPRAHT